MDIILQATSANLNSYVFIARQDGGLPEEYQLLSRDNLGFDISTSASVLQILDKNGDGRDDIEIFQNGERVVSLLSDPEGMFPSVDLELPVGAAPEQLFAGLCRALEAKNVGLASRYFTADVAARYESAFSGLSEVLPAIANDFDSLHPIKVFESYRSYAFEYGGPNNEQLVGIVVYVKDEDGIWRISSL